MHADVPLGLDLASGPGVLPLDGSAVRRAFEQQQLVWTTTKAVQVLSGADASTGSTVRRCRPYPTLGESATYTWTSPPARKFPPLPAKRDSGQLALFD